MIPPNKFKNMYTGEYGLLTAPDVTTTYLFTDFELKHALATFMHPSLSIS
jgi:hypothetical protein|tara:strand:- start:509 stop:658 length:150 start_codon:yes stop_codon:yes gene_type:complete